MKLYVGNLSYDATEEDVRQIFEGVGPVSSVNMITDRDTGRPKGFAFVEMENKNDGDKAISELNDVDVKGRSIKVSVARPKTAQSSGPRRFNNNRY
ncbi:MAG: RNA-binding protein [uncultured bacterium]|nr:MAG: RNA-binding protein [uncultured bacterium]